MQVRVLGVWMLGLLVSFQSFGQRVVDQVSIDPQEQVVLFDSVSIVAFDTVFEPGELFPDFQTISIDEEVFDLNGILQSAVAEQRVPLIAFGRPSCNQLRDLYEHVLLPVLEDVEEEVSVFHLANSIEAHATNGYQTPYYGVFNGQVHPAPQIPLVNQGFEFNQPYNGEELMTLSEGFVDKMVETGVGEEEDFEDITILLDSPDGGFTEAFNGPAIIWVLDPFTSAVVYESVEFQCAGNQQEGCAFEQQELLDAIRDVQDMFSVVGIQDGAAQDLIEIEHFSLTGQEGISGFKLFYNPITKQKVLKPAQ